MKLLKKLKAFFTPGINKDKALLRAYQRYVRLEKSIRTFQKATPNKEEVFRQFKKARADLLRATQDYLEEHD